MADPRTLHEELPASPKKALVLSILTGARVSALITPVVGLDQ
jgi:hypothetical protein